MIQENYFLKNQDLQDHFSRITDWEEIVPLYENNYQDAKTYQENSDPRYEMAPTNLEEALSFYEEILKTTGDISGNYVSQVAGEIDREGLKFENGKVTHPSRMVEMIDMYQESGLHTVPFLRKNGGLGLPNTMKALISEVMYRSDTSITIASASIGLSAILEKVATPEECEEIIPRYLKERFTGTMGLSEPDYGSDLPEVKTKAVPDPKNPGKWLLSGTKRYQTVACGINGNPGMTLVLARTGSPDSGARGLSFFLAESKDYEIIGLEKKLGLKASATCEVVYDNTPARLVGKQGYGLVKYVMGMLNGARLSVASQGVGLATAAHEEAKKYAKERIQFGKPIAEIPAVKKMLDEMDREISAMRCLMMEAAYSVDKYVWSQDRDLPRGSKESELAKKWEKIANTLTPISKYYNSETAIHVVNTGLQVLGGAGFTEDYDLARLYRDVRITNIYDGTTQIQINSAIGGIVSGMGKEGIFREYIDSLFKQGSQVSILSEIYSIFEQVVATYKSIESRDCKDALAFEVVSSSARLILSLLMDRAQQKCPSPDRSSKNDSFHIDSLVIVKGNLIKLMNSCIKSNGL